MYSRACKTQINLSDLYDAKTMCSDHVSSHCYCLLAFPRIYLGRSSKTFPFSEHCVSLSPVHPIPVRVPRRTKRMERNHEKPHRNTQHILHEDFVSFLRNKPLVQIAQGAFKSFTQRTDNPKTQFYGKYCIDKPTSHPVSPSRLSSRHAQVHWTQMF